MQRAWIAAALTFAVTAVLLSYLAWSQSRDARGATADAAHPHTVRLDQLTARVERIEAELAGIRTRRAAALDDADGALQGRTISAALDPAAAKTVGSPEDSALAEGGDLDEAAVARRVRRLSRVANLNESQAAAVFKALATERSTIATLRQGANAGAGGPRADIQAIRRQTDRELERILDDKQYAEYESMRHRAKQRARAGVQSTASAPVELPAPTMSH